MDNQKRIYKQHDKLIKRLAVQVTQQDYDKLISYARLHNTTYNLIIRKLINSHLDDFSLD